MPSSSHLVDGSAIVTGNAYDKYRTRNPIARRLQAGFLRAANELVDRVLHACGEADRPPRVLEVGCGPGDLAAHLFAGRQVSYSGLDVDLYQVDRMRSTLLAQRAEGPGTTDALVASAYQLPFAPNSFDLVLACEVLEHLEEPDLAVREIARVTRGPALFSVPWEPTWRLLNLLRGSYLRQVGNTPGHVQHFSRAAFRALLRTHFEPVAERRPLPWTMMLARRPVSA